MTTDAGSKPIDSLVAKLGDPVLRGALFETIIENMNESVLVVDRTGKQLYGNGVLRAFSGESAATRDLDEWRKPRTMTISDAEGRVLPHDQWPVARALRGDHQDNFEIRVVGMRHAPGETVLLTSTRSLRDAEGNIEGAVVVTHDITAARQTEEKLRQSQKLETIGQLTGGVAHDFNNMLAAIVSSVEVLKKGVAGNVRLEQAAATAERAALRGADLTRHLLAFARKQTLQPVATDIDALVRDALLIARPALGATIEVDVRSQGGPLFALVDPAQLTAALLNLCINARDAMPAGGGKITIGVDRSGNYVSIAVADNGLGMSEEVRARAVEPFFTTKGVGKGSGLGLSMVYGFVQQSGGDLRIESALGVGTTITLLLPLTDAPRETARPSTGGVQAGGRLRVLVVDDDDLVRDALCMQLGDEGFAAFAAPDGPAALAIVEGGLSFDLLISDVVMPKGMSGVDLVAEVRRRLPEVRAILSTGYADLDFSDPHIALLRKPYTAQELFAALRAAVLSPLP